MQNQQLTSDEKPSLFMPYSPALRQLLGSYGASLLLIYLEREPQDHFTLHIDRTSVRLYLSPVTFWKHVRMIAVGWRAERSRSLARQAGREFLTRATRGSGAHKPYSYVRIDKRTLAFHRNRPRVNQLLAQAGLIPQSLCGNDGRGMGGFSSRLSEFDAEIMASAVTGAKSFVSEVLAPLNDARRKTGIKRSPHTRRPWTEERRAKYDESIRLRRAKYDESIRLRRLGALGR
jgi:hypothetical protein